MHYLFRSKQSADFQMPAHCLQGLLAAVAQQVLGVPQVQAEAQSQLAQGLVKPPTDFH